MTILRTQGAPSQSPEWYRLMHYHHAAPFGRLVSEIDGPGFFFAPDGKTNPEAEFEASRRAFAGHQPVGLLHQDPQCAFPERFRFIKKVLGQHYDEVPCPLLGRYLDQFDADSVTLVFSGARQDSPATMFGHTFFRINSRKKGQSELLDQGLSYAATAPPEDGPLYFYWAGMTGGYPGHYSSMPYYQKVNEYSNAESRDLWEYQLSLTREQTLRLLRHAWEIETNSWSNYYFFDGNCSYALLALLEVARPDWDLTPFALYVIPSEMIKRVSRIPGAVVRVTYRPSLKKKLEAQIAALSESEQQSFYELIDGSVDPTQLDHPSVLDAAATYYLFEKQKRDGKLPPEMYFKMRQILARRSELPSAPAPAVVIDRDRDRDPSTRPDIGHDAIQLSLGAGSARYGEGRGSPTLFQELKIRSAYHDLLNNDEGFTRFSEIEFPSLALRYYPAPETFEIDHLTLLSIVSLFPLSRIEPKPSWQLLIEYFSPKDASCDDCHAFHFQSGTGLSVPLFSSSAVASLMALGDFQAGNWQPAPQGRWLRAGPGAQALAVLNPFAPYKTKIAATLLTDVLPTDAPNRSMLRYELEWGHAVSLGTQWDARLSWQGFFLGSGPRRYYDESLLSINHYF